MSRVLPILFETDMVRVILDGRKTVTRRVVKTPTENVEKWFKQGILKPPYQPGDIMYVRETWQECCRYTVHSPITHCKYCYRASGESAFYGCIEECGEICNWRPSIHMPKEAARIWLKVKDVRVERLQDMETENDQNYIAEGAKDKHDFIRLWDSTVSDREHYGWHANPWVWVIEFERCEKPEG